MRFLSSRRRHPAARALLLVLALFVVGALYAGFAPAKQVSADTATSQQVAEGKALFAVGCSSCHGLNGEGQQSGEIQGPSLAGVGAAAVEFQVGTGRMPLARPEEQAPVKPNRYTPEEVAALEAYVAGRQAATRRFTAFLRSVSREGDPDLAGLTLAVRQLRALAG